MRPILFEIPGLGWPLQSYGVAMGLALLVAWFVSLDRARRDGLPTEALGTLFVVATFAGIVGARGLWLLQHPGAGGIGDLLSLQAGGLTITGGLLAALLVTAIGCRRRGIDTFAWLDAVAPGFAMGLVIERIGAFLAGVEFGRYVAPGDLGYALHVTFPAGSPVHAFHQQILKGLPTLSAEASAPVHPVQLYAALMGLGILALAALVRRRRRYPGQVALAVLAAFAIARLVIEDPLRFDASPTLWGPIRLGHVSALGLLGVIAVVARLRRQAAMPTAEAR